MFERSGKKYDQILSLKPARILLIQLGDIGDVVLTIPCVLALREAFPESAVHVVTHFRTAAVLEDCPSIGKVFVVERESSSFASRIAFHRQFFKCIRREAYDVVFDMRTGDRGAIIAFFSGAAIRVAFNAGKGHWLRNHCFTHLVPELFPLDVHMVDRLLSLLRVLNVSSVSREPELLIGEWKQDVALKLLRDAGVPDARPILAIQPFSLWGYKEWGDEKVVALVEKVKNELGWIVIVMGSPEERRRVDGIVSRIGCGVYNLAGKTPLNLYAAVLQKAHHFVGMDSVGLHLAAAVGVPTLGIYGPSLSCVWAPRGRMHCVVTADLPCVPCGHKGCMDSEKSKCLEVLSVEKVWEALQSQLSD